jgi:hypothetical protein
MEPIWAPCKNLRATITVDEIPAFRYIAAPKDFTYGQEALAMSDRKGSDLDKTVSECQHRRLLERVPDREGHKTDMMKCCECGAIVFKPARKARPS